VHKDGTSRLESKYDDAAGEFERLTWVWMETDPDAGWVLPE